MEEATMRGQSWLVLLLYVGLWAAAWRLAPNGTITYVGLSILAATLVCGGFHLLIYVIPSEPRKDLKKTDIKTEFLSARAAYFAVIVGLVMFALVAVAAVLARVIITVRKP